MIFKPRSYVTNKFSTLEVFCHAPACLYPETFNNVKHIMLRWTSSFFACAHTLARLDVHYYASLCHVRRIRRFYLLAVTIHEVHHATAEASILCSQALKAIQSTVNHSALAISCHLLAPFLQTMLRQTVASRLHKKCQEMTSIIGNVMLCWCILLR